MKGAWKLIVIVLLTLAVISALSARPIPESATPIGSSSRVFRNHPQKTPFDQIDPSLRKIPRSGANPIQNK